MAERDDFLSTDLSDRSDDDWPARASATIVQYVGTVRDKTTGPALSVTRTMVYALAMGLIGLVVLVLALILLVRVLVAATAYIPGVGNGEPWLAYAIIAVLFWIVGAVLWRMKER